VHPWRGGGLALRDFSWEHHCKRLLLRWRAHLHYRRLRAASGDDQPEELHKYQPAKRTDQEICL
ncbi:MAG: hypothetical protein AVDCRST_MAG37-162, partial [uncultured Rubrobacteraceae bacterium]